MSRRTEATSGPRDGGIFGRLGDLVVRWPLVVIGLWVAVAAFLPLALPSLKQMVDRYPAAILPANAPSAVTTRQMTQAFHESGSDNVLVVVLSNEKGLGPPDEPGYRALADTLRRDTRDVLMVQDFLSTPPLREVLVSKDHKAWLLRVGVAGELGSPQSFAAYSRVADIVKQTVAGSTMAANLTGPAATVADLTAVGARSQIHIEIAMVIMVLVILLIIYRNPVTMLLPLITIGVSLVTAQAVVAGLAELGLGVSNQTIIFLNGMMFGAGTDYTVFVISRYHDHLRLGANSDQAVKRGLTSIGRVLAASAATVACTFLAMIFAKLGVFSTVGVALAIAIGIAFLAAITLLPAMLVLAGSRSWIAPGRDLSTRFWRRSGIRIVRRPKVNLVASLIVLSILAGCASLVHFNYDDRKILPSSVESSVGYAAMDRHFAVSSTIPEYLFVQSPQDLRTPQALAALEQMAQRVSQLPGIATIRGITRPSGQPLEQTSTTFQVGEVGNRLSDAAKQIAGRAGDLNRLTSGADALAGNLGNLRGGVTQAITTVRGLVDALAYMQRQFGGDKTLGEIDRTAKLVTSMRELGDSLGINLENVATSFDWAGPVLTSLNSSPSCDVDPSCTGARGQLQRFVTARDDGTFDKVAALARQLQWTQDSQTVESSTKGLQAVLDNATNALRSLGLDDPGAMSERLTIWQQGADTLADASRQLADGVQQVVDQAKQVGSGLGDASALLLAMKNNSAGSPPAFYIPPQVMDLDDFKQAAAAFVSPDGHAVRYLIQTKLNPFGTDAMDQVNSITNTARGAQPNTVLADASISMAGYPAMLRDTRDYYNHDIRFIVAATIMIVLVVLILLLRAIVAPLYLIGSVVISYLSALGIGVIFFQFILGQELHWSVPGLTFIILVAVGADYNMLLMSRIRDESPQGMRSGVIRTVGSTGGVITAAGVIFTASMFGLLFASISTVVQTGLIVGAGILLDTFLVRTVTVPATAVLVGRANWWPSRWRPHSSVGRAGEIV